MGMVIGLIGLVAALVLAVVGGVVGWRLAKDSNWKFLLVLLGIALGAVLGFAGGFGLGWLLLAGAMG